MIALLDESAAVVPNGYRLTRVHRTEAGHTVRIRVVRDHYPVQSLAVAEVLNARLEWTELADSSSSVWHRETPAKVDTKLQAALVLDDLAIALLERAVAILPGGESR